MKNILSEIYEHKLIEVRKCKKELSLQQICAFIKCNKNSSQENNFFNALQKKNEKKEVALICEIKKASPSHGLIRKDFDVKKIAEAYELAGATCLSVLTDEKYFMGSSQFLKEAKSASTLPILRKDFMVDAYQIYEAKMLGADCILLIIAMLDDVSLRELEQIALDIGLSVLLEVHNESEMQRASKLKSKLLGINNRNLKSLAVDLNTSLNLAKLAPKDYVLVGESGIKNSEEIKLMQNAGINCFLIGEHFMKQKNIGDAVKKILE